MAMAVNVPAAIAQLQSELADLNRRLPSMRDEYRRYEINLRGGSDQTLVDMGLQIRAMEARINDINQQLMNFQQTLTSQPTPTEPMPGGGYPLPPTPAPTPTGPMTGGGYPLPPTNTMPGIRKVKRYTVRVSNAWRQAQAAKGLDPDQVIKSMVPPGAPYTIVGI